MLESSGPALLRYDMSDYEVIRPGRYVLCAVTGEPILVGALKYWSAQHQEAYRGAAEACAALSAGGARNLRKD
jgi:hypothetical protein